MDVHIYGDFMKIEARAVKIYKPEILLCPKCGNQLKYNYTVSNKVVQFTSGKAFRIKNMGYSCKECNDSNVYFSQAATKLCFKGYTYSAKTVCMIDYYKCQGFGRDAICDILTQKGIFISDRNIDVLYKKVRSYIDADYDTLINEYYKRSIEEFNSIRISIDLITIKEKCYIIFYDYYKGDILALWVSNGLDDNNLLELLRKYLSNEKIELVVTVRSYISKFVPILKEITPKNTKFISYPKF